MVEIFVTPHNYVGPYRLSFSHGLALLREEKYGNGEDFLQPSGTSFIRSIRRSQLFSFTSFGSVPGNEFVFTKSDVSAIRCI